MNLGRLAVFILLQRVKVLRAVKVLAAGAVETVTSNKPADSKVARMASVVVSQLWLFRPSIRRTRISAVVLNKTPESKTRWREKLHVLL